MHLTRMPMPEGTIFTVGHVSDRTRYDASVPVPAFQYEVTDAGTIDAVCRVCPARSTLDTEKMLLVVIHDDDCSEYAELLEVAHRT